MLENARRFYSKLAGLYDSFFPAESGTIEHLVAHGAAPGARVIDLACGTGLYTDALLLRGADVVGLDGSPELIKLGQARSSHPERLRVLDMTALGTWPHREQDLVFCIGNSLPHLSDVSEVRGVIGAAASLLRAGTGQFVLQYVDTEELSAGESRVLPTLESDGVEFRREYVRVSPDSVEFRAKLVDRRSAASDDITNTLLIFRTKEVLQWLHETGLEAGEVTGGFAGQPVAGSWVRVIAATRRGAP
jgi:SAM-dependent methyltransferase